jgi:BioD-like phosphotransacetylase family protein
VVTEERLLASPTLGEVARALAAETLFFDSRAEALLDNTLIAPISADPGQGYFARLGANSVIVRSDKPDLQLAALNAGATCLIVTGGLPILHYVRERAEADEIPIISTQMETLDAVKAIEELYAGTPFSGSREKMRRLDEAASLDLSRLLAA